jgi:hypothetical protein
MPFLQTSVLLGLGRAPGRGARRVGEKDLMRGVCITPKMTSEIGGVRETSAWHWEDIWQQQTAIPNMLR